MAEVTRKGERQWLNRFERGQEQPFANRYGAFDTEVPSLSLGEISSLSKASGIHPDVLGPLRRAAAKLGWYIMVRPIGKRDDQDVPPAMEHVGEFAKLPKPEAIKTKTDPKTGLVRFGNKAALTRAIRAGKIDPDYAEKEGLALDEKGFLVNSRGQRFYSDLDLYEVLDARSGRPVRLGSGDRPHGGVRNRRELDILINILRPMGTDFALIQHGPDRQWIHHKPGKREAITVFCPDGEVTVLQPREVKPFIHRVRMAAGGT